MICDAVFVVVASTKRKTKTERRRQGVVRRMTNLRPTIGDLVRSLAYFTSQ